MAKKVRRVNTKPAVWPIPQEMQLGRGRIPVEDLVIVLPKQMSEQDAYPAKLFAEVVADHHLITVPIVRGRTPRGKVPVLIGRAGPKYTAGAAKGLKVTKSNPGAEGYALSVTKKGVRVVGSDYRGTLFGVQTLLELIESKDGKVGLREAKVRDWPYLPMRYVHIFVPGKETLAFFKRYMRDFLLRYKFNGMILEVAAGMRFDSHPEVSTAYAKMVKELCAVGDLTYVQNESCPLGPDKRFQDTTHRGVGYGSYIEKDELRELARYARKLGLDVMPEIQSLSHAYYIAYGDRETAEIPEALFPDAYCPNNPKSYRILFDIMEEYLEVLEPTRVHIGHDEWRAAGVCPRCRGKDTGKFFARDVIKIYKWLRARGIEVWMWGDQFVSSHNLKGRQSRSKHVWYCFADTESAPDLVEKECPDLKFTNWSWGQGPHTDKELSARGWEFMYGNFAGLRFPNWPERSAQPACLGGEVSSWSAAEEFELGRQQFPNATYSINMFWSKHWPSRAKGMEMVAGLLPDVRQRMSGEDVPSSVAWSRRIHTVNISRAANARLKERTWDLSGLTGGAMVFNGLPLRLPRGRGKSAVVVSRPGERSRYPVMVEGIPVKGKYNSLVFFHAAAKAGRRPVHAGDATMYPRDSADPLGCYEIVYENGQKDLAVIRYGENVGAWDQGLPAMFYHARSIVAGALPDGRPLVVWGFEWVNPRPEIAISQVNMFGIRGRTRPSREYLEGVYPILLGITAIERPRLEDYRT